MKRLLEEHRVVFCPAASMANLRASVDTAVTHSRVVSNIQSQLKGFDPDPDYVAQIVRQVDQHLLTGPNPNYRKWTEVLATASEAFDEVAMRPGYEWLYPRDPRSGGPSLDRIVGLRSGLARLSDLVAAGITDFEMDEELPVLLEVCFPTLNLHEVTGASGVKDVDAREVVRALHRIDNLPPLGQFARDRGWSSGELIDTVLSDEANNLRVWLRQNAVPGLDVREAYIATERKLPSKKKWNGWLRFGAVTGVSTAVGLLFANPIAGALAGAAIGATDQAVGADAQKRLVDPYHPNSWLSFVKRL
jgi:hypothetical protein